MHYLAIFIDFILRLNVHLTSLIEHVGNWSYLILFIIIFAETGLVILPILPGDSLLFTAGYLTSINQLNISYLLISLIIAAALGNTINYAIGWWLGGKIFHFPKSRWFNPMYLQKAHCFYEKYGGRAVILARFIPIIRTFVPFAAGIAKMGWLRFQWLTISSAVIWVGLILYLGHTFGNVPTVANNFSIVIIATVIISIVPAIIKGIKHRRNKI